MNSIKQDQRFMGKFVTIKVALTYLRTKKGTIPTSRNTIEQHIKKGDLDIVLLCPGTESETRCFYIKQLEEITKRAIIAREESS